MAGHHVIYGPTLANPAHGSLKLRTANGVGNAHLVWAGTWWPVGWVSENGTLNVGTLQTS